MMLFTGVMMFVAALDGRGNDTKSLPILITSVGAILSLYAMYRVGYLKSGFDKIPKEKRNEKIGQRKVLLSQVFETLLYFVVVAVGVFLLVNEGFMNKVLNLMAGGFTVLNGVLGAIRAYKTRENKDFHWKLMLVLVVVELLIGPYFIFASDSIGINGYIIMGVVTIAAGTIEVISAMTRDNLKCALDDGKEIVHIIKDGEKSEE